MEFKIWVKKNDKKQGWSGRGTNLRYLSLIFALMIIRNFSDFCSCDNKKFFVMFCGMWFFAWEIFWRCYYWSLWCCFFLPFGAVFFFILYWEFRVSNRYLLIGKGRNQNVLPCCKIAFLFLWNNCFLLLRFLWTHWYV